YSMHRTLRSVRRADMVVHLIDATGPISQVDKKLAGHVQKHYKPVVIVLNKWDLAEQLELETYQDYVDQYLSGMAFAPMAAMSALTGQNVEDVFKLAAELYRQSGTRVTTGELNRVVQAAVGRCSPGASRTKKLKIKYATQVGTHPPHIVVFCNDRSLVRADYGRYLAGRLRDELPFGEVPIRIDFRSSGRRSRGKEPTRKKAVKQKTPPRKGGSGRGTKKK
ncbi:MAG: GTP-binding protein, partial [Planctomycetota bacterium]